MPVTRKRFLVGNVRGTMVSHRTPSAQYLCNFHQFKVNTNYLLERFKDFTGCGGYGVIRKRCQSANSKL